MTYTIIIVMHICIFFILLCERFRNASHPSHANNPKLNASLFFRPKISLYFQSLHKELHLHIQYHGLSVQKGLHIAYGFPPIRQINGFFDAFCKLSNAMVMFYSSCRQCLPSLRIHPGRVTKRSQIAFTPHAQDDI